MSILASHAQYARLAWSIDEGQPVEQPSIVADRYPRDFSLNDGLA